MIVAELKKYLQNSKSVNILELSQRFAVSVDVIRAMLSLLQRKGKVKKHDDSANCGSSCNQCSPLLLESYEWVED